MENTRQTILDILRRRKHGTVESLTRELGLAPATVRRHLDILMRDGHVDVQQVRRETGRPHYVFSLSEAGEDLFPKHYVSLTNRLIEGVEKLTREDTKGRDGAQLVEIVFSRMADQLAQQYGPRIVAEGLRERVEQVAAVLAEEGLSLVPQETPDAFIILGQGCPTRRVRENHDQVCLLHRRLLSKLLGTEVDLSQSDACALEEYCAYRVPKQ